MYVNIHVHVDVDIHVHVDVDVNILVDVGVQGNARLDAYVHIRKCC